MSIILMTFASRQLVTVGFIIAGIANSLLLNVYQLWMICILGSCRSMVAAGQ